MIRIRDRSGKVHDIDEATTAKFIDRLEQSARFELNAETGERLPASPGAHAAALLREAVHSREVVEFELDQLDAVRLVITAWAEEAAEGEEELPC